MTSPKKRALWAVASASLAVAIVAFLLARRAAPPNLIRDSAATSARSVEGRLASFPWRPSSPRTRGTNSELPSDARILGAAADVISESPDDHQKGVAYLVIGNRNAAIASLEAAAKASPDARSWNDLAVAYDERAIREDLPGDLPRALAAVDQALQSSRLPEALFNRAMVLEHMGLQERALQAWNTYLATEGATPWADEARTHAARLHEVERPLDFAKTTRDSRASFDAGDATATDRLVRASPQQARGWGEGPLLVQWADYVLTGDAEQAEKSLTFVRAVGRSLAAFNGEQLLVDSVASIDGASEPARRRLAEAQRLYDAGRKKYATRLPSEAEPLLRKAAEEFAKAGSPMAENARYYAANATFDQNRGDEAWKELRAIEQRCDGTAHRALCAGVRWQLALRATAAGDWSAALIAAGTSANTFAALHEPAGFAAVKAIAANALDVIGNVDQAWNLRVEAFTEYSRLRSRDRIAAALTSAAQSEARRGHLAVSRSLVNLAAEEMQKSESVTYSRTLAERIRIVAGSEDRKATLELIADARQSAARILDPALRETTERRIDIYEAVARRGDDPALSAAQIERVIAALEARNDRPYLPEAYLQLGRSRAAAGLKQQAVEAYLRGLDELRRQRRSVTEADSRSIFLDAAQPLVAEGAALLLELGDAMRAFAVTDASRGLSIRERTGDSDASLVNARAVMRSLPRDAALLEYLMLPHSLAIFVVSPDDIAVVQVPGERDSLRALIARYDQAARGDGDQPAAEAAYDVLIAPVAARLAGANELIIVGDQELQSTPFAGLYDRASKRYLIERFAIRSAVAGGLISPATQNELEPALVVASSGSPGERLQGVEGEAKRVAGISRALLMAGNDATPQRFSAEAGRFSLIHYAGHAVSNRAGATGALLLTSAVYASDITRWNLKRHPLVVLAGCGTIRGDTSHVEGMPSIARAFLGAGARSVVGTLWDIDDHASADFFVSFHRHLRDGLSPSASVRAAQLEMLRSPDATLRRPAVWAGIQVLGFM